MFNYKKRTPLNPSVFDIVKGEMVLQHDEYYPLLTIGFNQYGQDVIHVIIEEDDDYVYYFNLVVSEADMFSFYGLLCPLLFCFQNAHMICIKKYKVDTDDLVDTDLIYFADIPEDYLPHITAILE